MLTSKKSLRSFLPVIWAVIGVFLLAPAFLQAQIEVIENGDVGIGTDAPTAKLDVNGSWRWRNATTAGNVVVVDDPQGNMTTVSLDDLLAQAGGIPLGNIYYVSRKFEGYANASNPDYVTQLDLAARGDIDKTYPDPWSARDAAIAAIGNSEITTALIFVLPGQVYTYGDESNSNNGTADFSSTPFEVDKKVTSSTKADINLYHEGISYYFNKGSGLKNHCSAYSIRLVNIDGTTPKKFELFGDGDFYCYYGQWKGFDMEFVAVDNPKARLHFSAGNLFMQQWKTFDLPRVKEFNITVETAVMAGNAFFLCNNVETSLDTLVGNVKIKNIFNGEGVFGPYVDFWYLFIVKNAGPCQISIDVDNIYTTESGPIFYSNDPTLYNKVGVHIKNIDYRASETFGHLANPFNNCAFQIGDDLPGILVPAAIGNSYNIHVDNYLGDMPFLFYRGMNRKEGSKNNVFDVYCGDCTTRDAGQYAIRMDGGDGYNGANPDGALLKLRGSFRALDGPVISVTHKTSNVEIDATLSSEYASGIFNAGSIDVNSITMSAVAYPETPGTVFQSGSNLPNVRSLTVWDKTTKAYSDATPGTTNGTVTSVGLSMPTEFTVTGSPVTSSGTIGVTLNNQSSNTFLAGPVSGGAATPSFRAINAADLAAAGGATGSGSNGQVTFWTGSNSQSGSSNLFWDNVNTRLGLGTASPSADLTIKNGNSTTTGGIKLYESADPATYWNIFTGGGGNYAGYLNFCRNGQFIMNMDNAGAYYYKSLLINENGGSVSGSRIRPVQHGNSYLEFERVGGAGTDGISRLIAWGHLEFGTSSNAFAATVANDGKWGFNMANGSQGALLHAKGLGSTSSTYTARFMNSSSQYGFSLRDDRAVIFDNLTGSGNNLLQLDASGVASRSTIDPATIITSSGNAGGDVTGPFSNLQIVADAVTSAEIATNAVNTAEIVNGAVTGVKIGQEGATAGQVLEWNGTFWAPATDDGTAYTAGTGISIASNVITNTGDPNASDDITNSTVANGDLSGTYPNPTVDGLQSRPVSATAPTSGQVLKWNGTAWAPAADAGAPSGTSTQTLRYDATNTLVATSALTNDGTNIVMTGNAAVGNSNTSLAKLNVEGFTGGLTARINPGNFPINSTILQIGGSGTTQVYGLDDNVTVTGNNLIERLRNSSTFANSGALKQTIVAGTAAGDPANQFVVEGGGSTFTMGLDNSDNDNFKIQPLTALSSTTETGIKLTTAGKVGLNEVAPQTTLDASSNTDAITLPKGTIANRPGSTLPHIRYNTEFQGFEVKEANLSLESNWLRLTSMTVPGVATGASAGSGASVSISGNEMRGVITVVLGSSPSAGGVIFTVTIDKDFSLAPYISVTPANPIAATDVSKYYVSSIATGTWTLSANGTLSNPVGTTYKFYYQVQN